MVGLKWRHYRAGPVETAAALAAGALFCYGLYKATQLRGSRRFSPPGESPSRKDPEALDKLLDTAVADSMACSDPPTIAKADARLDQRH